MSISEKHWVFAILWLLLGERDPAQTELWQVVISLACYMLAAGYFIAMLVAMFKERKKCGS